MKVNGCPIELLEPEILRVKVFEPLLLLGQERFAGVDMRIRVRGGGYTSQIYAIRQAIAKGIVAYYQKCTCTRCLWRLMMSDRLRRSARGCTGLLRRTCRGPVLPVAIACTVRAGPEDALVWAMVSARAAPGGVLVFDSARLRSGYRPSCVFSVCAVLVTRAGAAWWSSWELILVQWGAALSHGCSAMEHGSILTVLLVLLCLIAPATCFGMPGRLYAQTWTRPLRRRSRTCSSRTTAACSWRTPAGVSRRSLVATAPAPASRSRTVDMF